MRLDRPAAVPAAARGFSAGFCAGDPLHAAGQKRYGMAGEGGDVLLPALRLYAVVPAAGGGACDRLLPVLFSLPFPAVAAYFSLGISRDALFAVRYLTGAGILVGSLLPNMLASLVINVAPVYGWMRAFFYGFFTAGRRLPRHAGALTPCGAGDHPVRHLDRGGGSYGRMALCAPSAGLGGGHLPAGAAAGVSLRRIRQRVGCGDGQPVASPPSALPSASIPVCSSGRPSSGR